MTDELNIGASFDASSLIAGLKNATDAFAEAATQITNAFTSMASAEAPFSTALDGLFESLINTSAGFETITPAEAAFSAALDSALPALEATTAALTAAAPAEAAFAAALDSLLEPMVALEGTGAALAADLAAIGPAAEAAALSLEATGAAASSAAVGVEALSASTAGTAEAISTIGTELADTNGQLLLFTEATAEATGQLNLFESQQAEIAATLAATGAAAEAVTEANTAVNISFAEGIAVSKGTASALEFLNSTEARSAASADEVAAAWQKVQAEAAKLGLVLRATADGFQFVIQEEEELNLKNSQLTNSLATVAARMAAVDLGVGQLGYGVGVLARQVGPLGSLLSAAFPVIAAVTLIDVVSNLIDRFDQMETAIRKSVQQFDDLAVSSYHSAEAIELSTLKMEDQINKLEGVPSENKLNAALLENTIQAQQLSKQLADATEKAIELLKTGEIGVVRSILTGQEGTGDLKEALDAKLLLLQQAQQHEQLIENSGNAELIKAARDRTAALTQEALNAAEKQKEINDKKIADRAAELQKDKTVTGGQFAPAQTVPGLAPDAAQKQADTDFTTRSGQIAATIEWLKGEQAAQEALTQAQATRKKLAEDSIQTEKQARDQAAQAPDIAAAETAGKKLSEAQKNEAEASYRATEESVKLQVDLAVMGGTERLQAEQDVAPRILAARRQLTSDLLAAQKTANEAAMQGLNAKAIVIAEDENGDKQMNDLAANSAAQTQLKKDNETKIAQIVRDGQTAELALTENGARERIASAEREATQAAQIAQRQTQAIVTAAAAQANAQQVQVKDKATLDTSQVDALQQVGVISLRAASAEKIEILRNEEVQLKAILAEEIATLTSQQSALQAALTTVPAGSSAAKELNDTYSRLSNTITKLTVEQKNLDTEFDKDAAAAQLKTAKQIEQQWLSTYSSITATFNKSVQGMITGQETLLQAARQIYTSIADLIISAILKAAEKWVFQHVVMLAAEKLFHVQSVAATIAAENAKAAAAKVSVIQQEAQQIALSTALDASYAKDTIAYTTAQTAQTAAAVTAKSIEAAAAIGAASAVVIADTHQAQADVFLQAIEAVPFPANLAAAPAAAATVGAEMAGFAVAEKGALLDSDMPVFAHAREMILPANISSGLQNVISTGGVGTERNGASGDTHVHVHMGDVTAMDTSGAAAVYKRSQKDLGKYVQKALRAGHMNFKRA